MRPLTAIWLGVAAVIAYGSIYPFDFQAQALDAATLREFLATCCQRPGRGDVLGNVVLFLPYGFFGIVSSGADGSFGKRVVPIIIGGTVFAFALQVAQFYLPSRDQNLQDVIWNAIGIVGGALAAEPARTTLRSARHDASLDLVPALLIGSWLLYRLIPFVPSIDLQVIKDSLKPLLLNPRIDGVGIFHDAVAWLIVASLLRSAYRRFDLSTYLPLGILVVFVAEIGIVHNALSLSNVAGATLAIAVWWGVLRRLEHSAHVLAALLCLALVAQGLTPFRFDAVPDSFAWLPFKGLLGGSMYVNAQAICEKVFLYGSLVYLLWQTRIHRVVGLLIAIGIVTAVEFGQVFVVGHTPEITDSVLLVLAAATIAALQARTQGTEPARAATPRPVRVAKEISVQPVTTESPVSESINLRRVHTEYLERRARRYRIDASQACINILDAFIEEQSKFRSALRLDSATKGLGSSDPDGNRWTEFPVGLAPEQKRKLERLSRKHGVSTSRLMRRIIARHMRMRTGSK